MSSVPNPESITRRLSALPSPSVSWKWSSSVLLATYAPPSPGSIPVGISKPSAKTFVESDIPSPSLSSSTITLSFAVCPGLICG